MGDSNKAELLAILRGLRIFSGSFQGQLVLESDSLNARMSTFVQKSWKFQFSSSEIKILSSWL